jgi:Mg-chelatase subunit ChlD
MAIQNYINHVVLVLDESASMTNHKRDLVRVADGQIEYLARRSQELDQETRVSVYVFSNEVKCLIYDKDVLRLAFYCRVL